jgi:quercetin dioxygenase-like cupin family protein
MKFYNIKNMIRGWFIGNFEPSIFKTCDFEVGHHLHTPGAEGQDHYHKIATELNYIVSGKVRVSSRICCDGDFFLYEPGDITDVEFVEDTHLIVIKWPSVPEDKYIVKEE